MTDISYKPDARKKGITPSIINDMFASSVWDDTGSDDLGFLPDQDQSAAVKASNASASGGSFPPEYASGSKPKPRNSSARFETGYRPNQLTSHAKQASRASRSAAGTSKYAAAAISKSLAIAENARVVVPQVSAASAPVQVYRAESVEARDHNNGWDVETVASTNENSYKVRDSVFPPAFGAGFRSQQQVQSLPASADVSKSGTLNSRPVSQIDVPFDIQIFKKTDIVKVAEKPKKIIVPKVPARCTGRKFICTTIFIVIGFGLAFIGIFFGLVNAGVIRLPSNPWSSNVAVDPNDPALQLIIPASIAPGASGCSNYPPRAALRSKQIQGFQTRNSALDSCSADSFRYTLTECDMLETLAPASGTPANYLNDYVRLYQPHLLNALEMYDLNCARDRLSNFLAQIKHETNGLMSMRQPTDGGSGAIHLLPRYFSKAINDIPYAKNIYNSLERKSFANKYSLDKLTDLGTRYSNGGASADERAFVDSVGALISRPEVTFLIAGWWFITGSQQVMGFLGCTDLRASADQGKGSYVNSGGQMASSTGFFENTRCIYGTNIDPGLDQRSGYFDQIRLFAATNWNCQTKTCPSEAS